MIFSKITIVFFATKTPKLKPQITNKFQPPNPKFKTSNVLVIENLNLGFVCDLYFCHL